MTNKTETLEQITRAEKEAQEAARKAQAAAEEARRKAEQARQRAETERSAAMRSYLEKLTAEHPEARKQALADQATARQALEDAVLNGGDVFRAYAAWCAAVVHVWEVETALTSQRQFAGHPAREVREPSFNFAIDIASIIDQHSMQLQQEAIDRIRDRRATFLAGKVSS